MANKYYNLQTIGGGGTPINNQDKTITENGEYTADSGYTGLGTVTVNVPTPMLDGDAVEAEVIAGKTFYSDNPLVKKTGTLVVPSGILPDWGFPEVEDITENYVAFIIADTNKTLTFSAGSTDSSGYSVVVTGGEAGNCIINGDTVALGTPVDIADGVNTVITVGDNGKVTDYNTSQGYKTFKILIFLAGWHELGTKLTSPKILHNADDQYVTYNSILYAHYNFNSNIVLGACYTAPSTSSNVGLISGDLEWLRLSNITAISDNSAFFNCRRLKTVILNEGLTSIGANTFNGDISLERIVLPSTLSATGVSVFQNCGTLNSVTIQSVFTVGRDFVSDCPKLRSLYLPNAPALYGQVFDGNFSLNEVLNSENLTITFTNAFNIEDIFNLLEFNFNNCSFNMSLNIEAGSGTSAQNVKGKLNQVKFAATSTFSSTTAPQLRIANQMMTKTAIIDVLNQIIATGVTGKTISLIGCTGNADFDATEKSDWATATGWTITW